MTDKQTEALKLALEAMGWTDEWRPEGLKEQAITAIRETLAEQPVQQEPVAFVNADHLQGLTLGNYGYVEIYTDESAGRIPLYTSPPASKPWVGLTADEVWQSNEVMALNAEMGLPMNQIMALIAWADAKLREKNA